MQRLAELAEIALEPVDRLEIEVIGGLVEQHQIDRRGQLGGEPDPAPLAAAQGRDRSRPCLHRVESQTLEHGVDPCLELVAALVREPLLIAAEARQVGVGHPLAQLGQTLRLAREIVLQRQQGAVTRGCGIPHRLGPAEVPVLVEHRDAQTGLARDRPRPAGARLPSISRSSVVLPAPLRPTMPQRSPAATVKFTSRSSVVAPNSTETSENERIVTRGIWRRGHPPASCRS